MDLHLQIVEGPGAGATVAVDRPLVIGRSDDADLCLGDARVSRHHARVAPSSAGGATVEDLGSSNGTFVNHQPAHAPVRLDPGDELLIGVTVLQLRTDAELAARPSGVRPVPAALATQEHRAAASGPQAIPPAEPIHPELERLRDERVRFQARAAPLAIFALAVLVVVVYLATR
ncbi:MAG: FHA domain-containing protein [Actinobacteria bacterium]|nr:MAG: FHA domain-containing protein [Actinomycetota bacterium]